LSQFVLVLISIQHFKKDEIHAFFASHNIFILRSDRATFLYFSDDFLIDLVRLCFRRNAEMHLQYLCYGFNCNYRGRANEPASSQSVCGGGTRHKTRAVVNVTYQEARSLALLPLFLSLSLFAPRAFNRWLVFLWCVFICGEAGAAHDVSTAAYTTKRFKGKRAE
jgi:hypothetical protein